MKGVIIIYINLYIDLPLICKVFILVSLTILCLSIFRVVRTSGQCDGGRVLINPNKTIMVICAGLDYLLLIISIVVHFTSGIITIKTLLGLAVIPSILLLLYFIYRNTGGDA